MNTKLIAAAIAGLSLAGTANAAIVGAVAATINEEGPGFGSIDDTFNQNGLSANYVSGVTDFDSFVASTTHSFIFSPNEWFSNNPSDTTSVTYDLGSILSIDRLALWNEESSGLGVLDLLVSSDGISFSSLLSGLLPTDNTEENYSADVFTFAATSFRYITFAASDCPQPEPGAGSFFESCAIGEVAFNTAGGVAPIPVPASLPLLALGLAGLGALRLRRKA